MSEQKQTELSRALMMEEHWHGEATKLRSERDALETEVERLRNAVRDIANEPDRDVQHGMASEALAGEVQP